MNEMIKTVTFNDVDYNIMDRITYKDVVYFFLVNSNDLNDVVIRKVESNNGGFYLSQLDENEFDEVMEVFVEKKNKEY